MQILGLINELIGLPELASEHGSMVDHMLEMVHWLITVLLIGWSAFFVFCLWRFRQKEIPRPVMSVSEDMLLPRRDWGCCCRGYFASRFCLPIMGRKKL